MEKLAASPPRNTFGVRDLALTTPHFAIAGRELTKFEAGATADGWRSVSC
ncbi:hypothetical protein [Streptomyces sp. NPDC001500]